MIILFNSLSQIDFYNNINDFNIEFIKLYENVHDLIIDFVVRRHYINIFKLRIRINIKQMMNIKFNITFNEIMSMIERFDNLNILKNQNREQSKIIVIFND